MTAVRGNMKRRPRRAAAIRAARGAARTRRWFTIGALAVLVGLQVLSPATLMVLMAGVLPSIIALFVDPDRSKRAAYSVAGFNIAGIVPVIGWLWDRGATRAAAIDLLSDPLVWLLMYGAAGIGLMLLNGLPVIARGYIEIRNAGEARRIKAEMAALKEEWGDGVAHPAIERTAPPRRPGAQ